MLETILNNPGLQHIAKEIFWNLDCNALEASSQVNQSSKQILENPFFWLEKLVRLGVVSKKNQEDWLKAIQSVKNSDEEKHVLAYLKWNLKKDGKFNKDGLVDLPCYTSPIVQKEFRNKIWGVCIFEIQDDRDQEWFDYQKSKVNDSVEMIKVLAPLTINPNSSYFYGGRATTPIYAATCNGHTEIVKTLAPLIDNPNAPDEYGFTPIHRAAVYGNTEIAKILAPLTDNPNAPDKDGCTPIHLAALNGSTEIVKILAPLTDIERNSLISLAACEGHTEIVKMLVPLTDNPNAPDVYGKTPLHLAARNGHQEIVEFLTSYKEARREPSTSCCIIL